MFIFTNAAIIQMKDMDGKESCRNFMTYEFFAIQLEQLTQNDIN